MAVKFFKRVRADIFYLRAILDTGAGQRRTWYPESSVSAVAQRKRLLIVLAFACVYFFWGSTFVAVRYGVRYLTPPFVSGFRSVTAGLIVLAILKARGRSLRLTRPQLWRLAILGWLLVTINNSAMGFAERYINAGYASLLTAIIPIAVAVVESIIPGGKPLSRVGWGGTVLGASGLFLLLWPAIRAGVAMEEAHAPASATLIGSAILSLGIIAWACGSLLSSRKPIPIDPFLATAFQLIIGGFTNLLFGTAIGGWQSAHWTPGVFAALAWLCIGGSLIGFSAFTYLLQNVPVTKVTTNAYVNPVVAVILSSMFLHETLQGSQWIAMGIILVAVAIVTAFGSKPVSMAIAVEADAA